MALRERSWAHTSQIHAKPREFGFLTFAIGFETIYELQLIHCVGKKGKQCLYHLYLEAVSVTNTRSQRSEDGESEGDLRMASSSHQLSFTSQDYEAIANFIEGAGSDAFRQILHSICPSIFGHELVKGKTTLNIDLFLFQGQEY